MRKTVRPFLKWAGGKRWLAHAGVLPSISVSGRYIEPFLGSGSMFFSCTPERALLSDANKELVELYEVVRDSPGALHDLLERHQRDHAPAHYYAVRGQVPQDKTARAARTLYLNRTCWNGLYRLNQKGEFNVPIGTKTRVIMEDDFTEASNALQCVEIVACDFSESLKRAGQGDLVYADPPYTVKHNNNGFIKYNERIFSWDDQIRLRDLSVEAARRGATVVISNADHHSLHELYRGIAVAKCVNRASVLSGRSSARGHISEAIFTINPVAVVALAPDPTELAPPGHAIYGAIAPHH